MPSRSLRLSTSLGFLARFASSVDFAKPSISLHLRALFAHPLPGVDFSKPSIPLQLYALFLDPLSGPNRFVIIYSILKLFFKTFSKTFQNAINNSIPEPFSKPKFWSFTFFFLLAMFLYSRCRHCILYCTRY